MNDHDYEECMKAIHQFHEYPVRNESDLPWDHDVCSDIYLGGYVE